MGNINGVNVSSGATNVVSVPTMLNVSPDALLEYCQIQLGALDSQITDSMNFQSKQLSDRTIIQKVQTTLESFGTAGPNQTQFQQCVDAFNTAIHSLPPGDPTAVKLQAQLDTMQQTYNPSTTQPVYDPSGNPVNDASGAQQMQTVSTFKSPSDGQWKGTTDAIDSLAGDIKSGADLQMLQLQDLVSQRQQAIQLCSGIMGKADQTLEAQAKAVGQ